MEPGKILIALGGLLLLGGLVLTYLPGLIGWFGRLPGDIRIESENGAVFIPITSMLLISLALSLLVNLFFRK